MSLEEEKESLESEILHIRQNVKRTTEEIQRVALIRERNLKQEYLVK